MNTKSRIASILKTESLSLKVTGAESFALSNLDLTVEPDFTLPGNLRLGHLAEKVVSGLIKTSTTYKLLNENVQLIEDKKTIGELDFILLEKATQRIIHVELAYKFYLYDPAIFSEPSKNWIGPNRNDTLHKKLEKLRMKQFPLLRHPATKAALPEVKVSQVDQALCFLVNLFVPVGHADDLDPAFARAVRGRYLSYAEFLDLDHSEKTYFVPSKKEWGMDAGDHDQWQRFEEVRSGIARSIAEQQSVLCWEKRGGDYRSLFVVWW